MMRPVSSAWTAAMCSATTPVSLKHGSRWAPLVVVAPHPDTWPFGVHHEDLPSWVRGGSDTGQTSFLPLGEVSDWSWPTSLRSATSPGDPHEASRRCRRLPRVPTGWDARTRGVDHSRGKPAATHAAYPRRAGHPAIPRASTMPIEGQFPRILTAPDFPRRATSLIAAPLSRP